MSGTGYGATPYGLTPWGGPPFASLQLALVAAVSENALQLRFTRPVYFSSLLDPPDASSRKRFTITPNAATFGRDGTPARPLLVTSVAIDDVPGVATGQVLRLTLDRPMTPFPATYVVGCSGLHSSDLNVTIDPNASTAEVLATYRALVPRSLDAAVSSARGDLANPQVASAALSAGIPSSLGTFGVDETGDYASDSGMVSYKKRILRRIMSRKNSFAHLKDFGAGIVDQGKKLSTAQRRAQIVADVEAQVAADPETRSVTCTVVPGTSPYLFRVQVLVVTTAGQTARFGMPIAA